MDLSKIDNIEFGEVTENDSPDFADTYISNANYNGEEMTESQLDEINENTEFVHEKLIEHLY
jgi:hypothetical protein